MCGRVGNATPGRGNIWSRKVASTGQKKKMATHIPQWINFFVARVFFADAHVLL